MALKYINEVIINAPREKVVELFQDPQYISEWQPGFISLEHISGTPGQENAKSKLLYKMGKREIEMIETITKMNLPDEFNGTYEAKGVLNVIENHFEDLGNGTTKYWSNNVFNFKGFMKVIGFLFPGMFKKESQKYLDLFKKFVESKI